MDRRSRTIVVVAVSLGAAVWLVVWLSVAVIVPLFQGAKCSGIEFRAGASSPTSEPANRPPIGGTGGVAGRVRAALRPGGAAVYCRDFADPFVLRVGDTFYAYATNNQDAHVPVLTSSGLFGTAHIAEALPKLPAWSSPGGVWAPAVLPRPAGFVLYYATLVDGSNRECLSSAFRPRPAGRSSTIRTDPSFVLLTRERSMRALSSTPAVSPISCGRAMRRRASSLRRSHRTAAR